MSILTGALGGFGRELTHLGRAAVKSNFEEQRIANLERLANLRYERDRKDYQTDRDEERAYNQSQQASFEDVYENGQLIGQRNSKTNQFSSLGGRSASSKGFDTKILSINGQDYPVAFDKDTGQFDYNSPVLKVPTISEGHALRIAEQEADERAGYFSSDSEDFSQFGGDRDLFIKSRASEIVNASRPISTLLSTFEQSGAGQSGSRPKSSFTTNTETQAEPVNEPGLIASEIEKPVRRTNANRYSRKPEATPDDLIDDLKVKNARGHEKISNNLPALVEELRAKSDRLTPEEKAEINSVIDEASRKDPSLIIPHLS